MANNPSYLQTALPVTSLVQYQEHLFHMYAHIGDSNDISVVPATTHPNRFGQTNVLDWDIRDGPETEANVVAQFRGLGMASGRSSISWHISSNIVFTDQRYKGSTLSVQGTLTSVVIGNEGDMTVIGGTGQFACAQGTLNYKKIQFDGNSSVLELQIRAVCLTFPKPKPVQKVGPWGGNGGTAYEIQEADQVPQRLVSITIYDGDVIESIEFSYTDQAGQTHTVGPWGGDDGKSANPPIQFGASETVKEIYGATGKYKGCTVVTSLTIVTNVMAYGPYGKQSRGNIPFHVAAPNDQSIVGFYGSADGEAVNQIGAYVICPN